jgi:regulatory protein
MREQVFQKAIAMLAARPRSEGQLREKLLARTGFEASEVEECIARLKELGYLDDRRFAQNYAAYRSNNRPVGRLRLARELAAKKVGRDAIRAALDCVSDAAAEEALIDRAIRKRVRTKGRPASPAESKRLFDHLARLGFEHDLIVRKIRVLRLVDLETDSDDL